MLNGKSIAQIMIAFIGAILAIVPFFAGDFLGWSLEAEMLAAATIAIATILAELILSFNSLRESLEHLYPSLDFSVHEQKNCIR